MDKKKLFLLVGSALILLSLAIYFTWESSEEESTATKSNKEESFWSLGKTTTTYTNFPDAPLPESDEEVARLWPHVLEPKDPNLKEKVRKEWEDFAKRYPDNIYIPREILGKELSKEEEKEILETLDSFTSIDSKFAAYTSASKWAAPGTEPPPGPISEKDANPQEMARYFNYKIREIESRIQLLEYTMEKARLSSIEENIAKSDIQKLKQELANLKEVQAQIPKG